MVVYDYAKTYADRPLVAAWFYALAPSIEVVLRVAESLGNTNIDIDPLSGSIVATSKGIIRQDLEARVSFDGIALKGFWKRKFYASPDELKRLNEILARLGVDSPIRSSEVEKVRRALTKDVEKQFERYGDVEELTLFGKRYLDDLNLPNELIGYDLTWNRTLRSNALQKVGLGSKAEVVEGVRHSTVYNRSYAGAKLTYAGEAVDGSFEYDGLGVTKMDIQVKELVKKLDSGIRAITIDGSREYV